MKPSYWYPGFGNDWLENIYEVDLSALDELSLYPTSFLGLPPGILLLLILFLLLGLSALLKSLRAWRWLAFQRNALQSLNSLERNYVNGDSKVLSGLNNILKQSAMHLSGRGTVASLSGKQWCDKFIEIQLTWNDESLCLDRRDITLLERLSYQKQNDEFPIDLGLLLISQLRHWLGSIHYREDLLSKGVTQ